MDWCWIRSRSRKGWVFPYCRCSRRSAREWSSWAGRSICSTGRILQRRLTFACIRAPRWRLSGRRCWDSWSRLVRRGGRGGCYWPSCGGAYSVFLEGEGDLLDSEEVVLGEVSQVEWVAWVVGLLGSVYLLVAIIRGRGTSYQLLSPYHNYISSTTHPLSNPHPLTFIGNIFPYLSQKSSEILRV